MLDAVLARAARTPQDEVSGFWAGNAIAGSLEKAEVQLGGQRLGIALGVFDQEMVTRLNVLQRGMPGNP